MTRCCHLRSCTPLLSCSVVCGLARVRLPHDSKTLTSSQHQPIAAPSVGSTGNFYIVEAGGEVSCFYRACSLLVCGSPHFNGSVRHVIAMELTAWECSTLLLHLTGDGTRASARYGAWASLADLVVVEGGAATTHLLAMDASLDIRRVRCGERTARAASLKGVVADEGSALWFVQHNPPRPARKMSTQQLAMLRLSPNRSVSSQPTCCGCRHLGGDRKPESRKTRLPKGVKRFTLELDKFVRSNHPHKIEARTTRAYNPAS